MTDNRRKLYDALNREYGDNFGPYEEFQQGFTDEATARKSYKTLRDAGISEDWLGDETNFVGSFFSLSPSDTSDQGDVSVRKGFNPTVDMIAANTARREQRMAAKKPEVKPAQVPVRQPAAQTADRPVQQPTEEVKNPDISKGFTLERNKDYVMSHERPSIFGKRYSEMDISLGEQGRDAEEGGDGTKYIARKQAVFTNFLNSPEGKKKMKEQMLEDTTSQFQSIDNEVQLAENQLKKDMQKAKEESGLSDWEARSTVGVRRPVYTDKQQKYLDAYQPLRDREHALQSANKMIDDTYKLMSAAKESEDGSIPSNLLSGFRDGVFDLDNWTMGLTSLAKSGYLLKALEKVDKGEELSKEEQILVDAATINAAMQSQLGDKLSRSYKAGQASGESIPFMVEMAFGTQAISSVTSALGRGILKNAAKFVAKHGGKKAAQQMAVRGGLGQVTKGALGFTKGVVDSAINTASIDLFRVFDDYTSRNIGDIQYKHTDDGKIEYAGRENKQYGLTPFMKSFLSTMFETQSEMVGEQFAPMLAFLGRGAATISGLSQQQVYKTFLKTLETSPGLRKMKDFFNRTQWHGVLGEYMEEVYNNILSYGIGDMTKDELLDLDNNIDTFLGVGVMGAFFGALGTGVYGHERYTQRKQIKDFENRWSGRDDVDIQQIREKVNSMSVAQAREYLKSIGAAQYLSEADKKDLMRYVTNLVRENGYSQANLDISEKKGNPEAAQVSEDLQNSYDEGADAEEPADKHEIANAVEEARAALITDETNPIEQQFADTVEQMKDNPTEAYDRLLEQGFDEEHIQRAVTYYNAVARYEGVMDTIEQTVEEQVNRAIDNVDSNTHSETGMIVPVTDSRSGVNGFLISGNIVYDELGNIDPAKSDKILIVRSEDGRDVMTNPRALSIAGQTQNPEDIKQQIQTSYRDSLMQEQTEQVDYPEEVLNHEAEPSERLIIDGEEWVMMGVNNRGDTYTISKVDENGNPIAGRTISRDEYLQALSQQEGQDIEGEAALQDAAQQAEETAAPEEQQEGVLQDETPQAEEQPIDEEDIKPIGTGYFGEIFDQFKGKVKEAVNFLRKKKSGDLLGVFSRDGVGDIDLVWGNDNAGLKHIIKRHILEQDDFNSIDEIASVIDDVIKNGEVTYESDGKLNIEYNGYKVSIKKKVFDEKGNMIGDKNWVVTAFDTTRSKGQKKRTSPSETLTTPPANPEADGVTLPSGEVLSDGEDSESEANKQKKQQKNAGNPVEEQTTPVIPTDDGGNELYEQVEPQATLDYLSNGSDDEEVTAMIEQNRKDAEKAVTSAERRKPKPGKSKAAYDRAKAEYEADLAGKRASMEYWEKVSALHEARMEESRRKARQEAASKQYTAQGSVPGWMADKPEDARARGYRMVGAEQVDRQQPVEGKEGSETATRFSEDRTPSGHYFLIEADQLQPSHQRGQRNPLHFIPEAQPKDRKDAASQLASQKIAKEINPQEITSATTAYTGAPTVNARGEVIQGNNRSDALKQMWGAGYEEQAAAYKQYLMDHAEEYGLKKEDIESMKAPVLVNRLDVSDEEAIELGQYNAADTESGGSERIKAPQTIQKLGDRLGSFISQLMSADDNEELNLTELLQRNGLKMLKWLATKKLISNTQVQSAVDKEGKLTENAVMDLKEILFGSVFQGAPTELRNIFDGMPTKAQRAILSTMYRDSQSEEADRIRDYVQQSIMAYNTLNKTYANFQKAKTAEEARLAVRDWAAQYSFTEEGKSLLNSDTFSNFALELAVTYKTYSQKEQQRLFNKFFDLVQGTKMGDMFEEERGKVSLADAVKETFGITLNEQSNGQNGSVPVAGKNPAGAGGEQDGPRSGGQRERNPQGEGPAETRGGTGGNGQEVEDETTPSEPAQANEPEQKGTFDDGKKTEEEAMNDFYENVVNEDAVDNLGDDENLLLAETAVLNPTLSDMKPKAAWEWLMNSLGKASDKALTEMKERYLGRKNLDRNEKRLLDAVSAELERRGKEKPAKEENEGTALSDEEKAEIESKAKEAAYNTVMDYYRDGGVKKPELWKKKAEQLYKNAVSKYGADSEQAIRQKGNLDGVQQAIDEIKKTKAEKKKPSKEKVDQSAMNGRTLFDAMEEQGYSDKIPEGNDVAVGQTYAMKDGRKVKVTGIHGADVTYQPEGSEVKETLSGSAFVENVSSKVEEDTSNHSSQSVLENPLVTDERYEELKRRLRAKVNNLNVGFDPEVLAIGMEMAAYHIERGARKFVDFSKAMIKEFGDGIRGYLKSFYNGARDMPGMEKLKAEMTPYEEVDATDVANIGKKEKDPIRSADMAKREKEVEDGKKEADKDKESTLNSSEYYLTLENRGGRIGIYRTKVGAVPVTDARPIVTATSYIEMEGILENPFNGLQDLLDEKKSDIAKAIRVGAAQERKKNAGIVQESKKESVPLLQKDTEKEAKEQLSTPEQHPNDELVGDSAKNQQRAKEEKDFVSELIHEINGRINMFLKGTTKPLAMRDIQAIADRYPSLKNGKKTDLQELVERAMTIVQRTVARKSVNEQTDIARMGFNQVVAGYMVQPNLNARDSSRVELQQYSTPTPFAFLMGRFIQAADNKVESLLEPSAGNGALTIGFDPKVVHANDIDAQRLANLRTMGFNKVTAQNGLEPFNETVDAVATNPPFGSVEPKDYDGYRISSLEGQMTINALESMKDDGRAAIIIGGHTEYTPFGSLKGKDRAFLGYLYQHYNVVDVINMDGDMYGRNGTKYPVRMILIDGRRKQDGNSYYAPVHEKARAEVVSTFNELFNRVEDDILSIEQQRKGEPVGRTDGRAAADNENASAVRDGGSNTQGTERGQRPVSDSKGLEGGTSRGLRTMAPRDSETGDRGGNERSGEHRDAGRVDSGARRSDSGADADRQRTSDQGERNNDNSGGRISDAGGSAVRNDAPRVRLTKEGDLEEKLPYQAKSQNYNIGSVMPAVQAEAVRKVLDGIGDVDEFVRSELGYSSKEELYGALAAEQIDSVAMAINQMNKGNAFIIGDMTGIGKGRQGAALIRYAIKKGKKPIFFTQKPALFSDMYRDLKDIGCGDLVPMIVASDPDEANIIDIENGNAKVIHKLKGPAARKKEMQHILETGEMPDGYDYMVVTYSQIQNGTVAYEVGNDGIKKKPKNKKDGNSPAEISGQLRRDALEKLMSNNYVILDESHTAGGSGNGGMYLQSIIPNVEGVTFMSATFAKRPDNMPIYAIRTDISKADCDAKELIEAIASGGVTLQEIMSKQLAESGQMIRRERDFTGVTIDWIEGEEEIDREQRKKFDEVASIFSAIKKFQDKYVKRTVDEMSKEMAERQGSAQQKKGTKDMGVTNAPFASKMYNMVNQLLFSMKCDAVVDRVISELKNGRKPVISFSNTMGTFISDLAGMEMNEMPTLSISLEKALNGVLRITKKDDKGKEEHSMLNPADLGPGALEEYNSVRQKILNLTSDLPISPIDYIQQKIREAGYSIGEITGREQYLGKTDSGKYKVMNLSKEEKDKKRNAAKFNSGDIDVLMINKAGSTGISLHASTKFKDQRQRVMIFAQFQSDINDEVQMRGRIDRTGQVCRAVYQYLMSSIPAERRLQMMFKAKLKSLDANTTSSQKSKFNDMEVVDYLNKYGDEVVWNYMSDHPELEDEFGDPLEMFGEDGNVKNKTNENYDGCSAKISRYLAFLPVSKQEEVFESITEAYKTKIRQLDEAGENDLEITTMPLNAETKSRKIWKAGKDNESGNAFSADTYVEEAEVDVLRKPMKLDEIKSSVESLSGGKPYNEWLEGKIEDMKSFMREKAKKRYEAAMERVQGRADMARKKSRDAAILSNNTGRTQLSDEQIETMANEAYKMALSNGREAAEKALHSMDQQFEDMRNSMQKFEPGKAIIVPRDIFDKNYDGDAIHLDLGTFLGYRIGREFTPSSSAAIFATLDGRRRVEVPLSKKNILDQIQRATWVQASYVHSFDLESDWNRKAPTATRRKAYIITGNLMQALVDLNKGMQKYQLVSFTMKDGSVRQGALLPENFDPSTLKDNVPISEMKSQIEVGNTVISADKNVTVQRSLRSYISAFEVRVPKTKQKGGKYFLDEKLKKLMRYEEFETQGNNMVGYFDKETLPKVLARLDKLGVTAMKESKLKEEKPEADTRRYRKVSDKKKIEQLDKEPTIKLYRAMQLIDGKLYPPMAAKVNGKLVEPSELGKWEEAEERPELIKDKKGKNQFTLNKGNGSQIDAAYNPYLHLSRSPLNDQFTSASQRPNLVTVEVEVPESELYSNYRAEGAKDTTGEMTWHAGPVSSRLPEGKKRKVVLSRWAKPVRIVPDKEVARKIADMLEGENIPIPSNTITPSLRKELEALGVPVKDVNKKYRFIGENGASALDQAKEREEIVNALGKAKQMEEAGMDTESIKSSTGWNRGEDGLWHYEMQVDSQSEEFTEMRDGITTDQQPMSVSDMSDVAPEERDELLDENGEYQSDHAYDEAFSINNVNQAIYSLAGKYMSRLYKDGMLGRVLTGEYATINTEKAKKEYEHAKTVLSDYKDELLNMKNSCTEAAWKEVQSVIDKIDRSIGYYKNLADGKDVWRTDEGSRYRLTDAIRSMAEAARPSSHLRMAEKAVTLAETLHTKVRLVMSLDELSEEERDAKGWYDTKTGEVVIVIPNHENTDDIESSIFHEILGHKGMRESMGDEAFNEFLDGVYRNCDDETRKRIARHILEGMDVHEATEEAIAEIAERMAGGERPGMFDRLAAALRNAMHSVLKRLGFDAYMPINEKDILYMMWRNRQKMERGDVMAYAKGVSMERALGVDFSGKRFRRAAAPVAHEAREIYDRNLQGMGYRFREAYQDSMLSLKHLQEAIIQKSGKPLQEKEDAYTSENQLSSRNTSDMEEFERAYYRPLVSAIKNFMKVLHLRSYDEVKKYLFAKSGLERNREFAVRDALNAVRDEENITPDLQDAIENYYAAKKENERKLAAGDISFMDFCQNMDEEAKFLIGLTYVGKDGMTRKKSDGTPFDVDAICESMLARDYSGLSSLFDADNFKADATDVVNFIEGIPNYKDAADELWKRINQTTDFSLKKGRDCGTISVDQYKKVSGMFSWYIPMRGFNDTTAAEVYDYLGKEGAFNATIKKAEGRVSLADDPIATICNMANSAVMNGNKNLMKVCLYNLAMNHPTDLLKVDYSWVKNVGTDADPVWEYAYPDINEDDDAQTIADKIEAFKDEMAALEEEGKAKQLKARLSLPYITTPREVPEHIVRVKINGKEYTIILNGNPRAAQAVNGLLGKDKAKDYGFKFVSGINRWMAGNFTKRSFTFVARNLTRDVIFGNAAVFVKEDRPYRRQFRKNELRIAANIAGLMRRYNKGKLDLSNPLDKHFADFIKYGGETGFVQLLSVDEYKKSLESDLKKRNPLSSGIINGYKALMNAIEFVNRCAEDYTRFNTYLTSREMGRSIKRSVSDAKEITVNFNKRGAGSATDGFLGWSAETLKSCFIFANAAIQSLNNFGKMAGEHKGKMAFAIGSFMSMGVLTPILNDLLIGALGGDDPDEYNNLPDYVRRNHVCIYMGGGNFFTIPLPIELRAFYGLGESLYQSANDNLSTGDASLAFASSMCELLPINFADEAGLFDAMTPTMAAPLVEAYVLNKNFTGRPIYRSSAYNKRDPEWTKAYSGTSKALTKLCKDVNELSGGDNVRSGKIDLNPARIEFLFSAYFGGFGQNFTEVSKMIQAACGVEDYRNTRNVPIVKAFIRQADERNNFATSRANYEKYRNWYEEQTHVRNGYKKQVRMGAVEYADRLKNEMEGKDNDKYNVMKVANSVLTRLYKQVPIYDSADDRKQIQYIIDLVKVMAVEKCKAIDRGELTADIDYDWIGKEMPSSDRSDTEQ